MQRQTAMYQWMKNRERRHLEAELQRQQPPKTPRVFVSSTPGPQLEVSGIAKQSGGRAKIVGMVIAVLALAAAADLLSGCTGAAAPKLASILVAEDDAGGVDLWTWANDQPAFDKHDFVLDPEQQRHLRLVR